jgi:hypothetical protein
MLIALDKRDGDRLRRILVEHLANKCDAALLAVMGPEPVTDPQPHEAALRSAKTPARRPPRHAPLPPPGKAADGKRGAVLRVAR